MLGAIIVTGGAVRVTGSGLGCSDWPNCEPGRLLPRGVSDGHAMIEFVNRMITGLVSLAVIVAVLGSLARVPRRRDLVWLSVGLVGGVIAQAVLGGLTVLFELRPEFVMGHFLLSLVLLTNAIVLYQRAGQPIGSPEHVVDPIVRRLGRTLLVTASIVVVSGTVVTSTGPHGGDEDARRFSLHLPDVARVHGAAVITFLALTLVTLYAVRRTSSPATVRRRLLVLLAVIGVQGAVGYYQYLDGIPALAVGFHIAGATSVWAATVSLYLGMSTRSVVASGSRSVAEGRGEALATV